MRAMPSSGSQSCSLPIADRTTPGRFGLTLHPDKTRVVDFLGLTHVSGRSRQGRRMVWQITAESRFVRAVAAVNDWCRESRHWSMRDQHHHLSAMMRHHDADCGVGGNGRRSRWVAHKVVRVLQKWLSRGDRQSVVRRARLREVLKRHPLPPVRIVHPYARCCERRSPVKNRMRDICSSGTVRGGAATSTHTEIGPVVLYHVSGTVGAVQHDEQDPPARTGHNASERGTRCVECSPVASWRRRIVDSWPAVSQLAFT